MTDKTDNPDFEEIDCTEAIGHLYAYLDGELKDKIALAQFEEHLNHCKSCFSRAQLEGMINRKLSSLKTDDAPESLQDRLKNIMDNL